MTALFDQGCEEPNGVAEEAAHRQMEDAIRSHDVTVDSVLFVNERWVAVVNIPCIGIVNNTFRYSAGTLKEMWSLTLEGVLKWKKTYTEVGRWPEYLNRRRA